MTSMEWKVLKAVLVDKAWMTFSPCLWVVAVEVVVDKNKK